MVAVQASRLSTGLHQLGKPGEVQESSKFRGCVDTFFGSGMRDSASAPYTLTSVGIFSIYIIFSLYITKGADREKLLNNEDFL